MINAHFTLSTDLISIFMMGLLGTAHCLGMCGPIIFAFPGRIGRFRAHLWYHAGRLGTYTLCGAIMGGIGSGLLQIPAQVTPSPLKWMLGMQMALSTVAAGIMLCLGLMRIGLLREPAWLAWASPQKLPGLDRFLKHLMATPSGPGMMLLGGLLGFIPCGLSYAAFAAALPSGGIWQGGRLLLVFSLGTLPGLLLLGSGLTGLLRKYRIQMDLLTGLVMIAVAIRMLLKSFQAI